MKRNRLKKVTSLLLACAMIATMFPVFSTDAHAEEAKLPTKEQFVTANELKIFNTDDNDGEVNAAKVYFGNNDQKWWIAGSQHEKGLTLFAEKAIEKNLKFARDFNNVGYDEKFACDYTSLGGVTPEVVNPNHYGASLLRDSLHKLENSYFTSKEQALMNYTTFNTKDRRNDSIYSITDKLYLAYGDYYDDKYITVGSNKLDSDKKLNTGLKIDKKYLAKDYFWLRAPSNEATNSLTGGNKGFAVNNGYVNGEYDLAPAFELNISNVSFASLASSATSEGTLPVNDAFTLRHSAKNLGSALVTYDKSKVMLSDVPANTYLVVQNSAVAKAKKITNETEVYAKEDFGLDSFENCKVWLETTDDRITYATLATEEQGSTVNVTLSEGMEVVSGNLVQKIGVNKPMTNIVIKAIDGYVFPVDYTIEEQSGITVTRENENQIVVSGTPTADVNITLVKPLKKAYSMEVLGNGTFANVCENYQAITAEEFTITNNGNVNINNINLAITGNDADKFELTWKETATIQPNETIKITIKPKDNLPVNAYQATLSVSADNIADIAKDLQFTVEEHDYESVVTSPTCIEGGYTTYVCKKCNHSYVGDEVEALGHELGEWEVVKEATVTEEGTKERHCNRCDYKETESIPMISKPAQPNDDNSDNNADTDLDNDSDNDSDGNLGNDSNKDNNTDKDNNSNTNNENPKTGDQINVTLFASIFIISALGIALLALLKKKKASEHK